MRSDFDHVASSYAAPQKIRTSERAIRQLYRPDAIGRKGPLNRRCDIRYPFGLNASSMLPPVWPNIA